MKKWKTVKTHIEAHRAGIVLLVLAVYLAVAGLSLAAAGETVLPGDVRASKAVQSAEFPGADRVERTGYFLGSYHGIISLALVLIAFLALTRRYSAALLVGGVLAIRGTNSLIKGLIDSPRPSPELVEIIEGATGDPQSLGFPSGHVMGSVLFYGCVIYLARTYVSRRRIRTLVEIVAVTVIVLVAWSRIFSGAHWLTDVIGGVLWGLALLIPLLYGHWLLRKRQQTG